MLRRGAGVQDQDWGENISVPFWTTPMVADSFLMIYHSNRKIHALGLLLTVA